MKKYPWNDAVSLLVIQILEGDNRELLSHFLTFRNNPSGLVKDFKGVLRARRPQFNPNPTIRAFDSTSYHTHTFHQIRKRAICQGCSFSGVPTQDSTKTGDSTPKGQPLAR